MGNILLSLGIGSAVVTGLLFGLWRGALEERDTARETLKAQTELTQQARDVADGWIKKYDSLSKDFLDVAVEGARSSERESMASANARYANSQLASLRRAEDDKIQDCSRVIVRDPADQRLRNNELEALVTGIAGSGAADTAFRAVRLPSSTGPLLLGDGDGVDGKPN